jgi:hypothetical protein
VARDELQQDNSGDLSFLGGISGDVYFLSDLVEQRLGSNIDDFYECYFTYI